MPIIYLAGFGAFSAMMYEMKEWLRYGEEGNPYMNRLGFEKGNPLRFIYRDGTWWFVWSRPNLCRRRVGYKNSIGPTTNRKS